MDPKYGDLARCAHPLVDKSFLASLKEKRPSAVFVATLVIWIQLIIAWTLAFLAPMWLIFVPFLITCAIVQAMVLWVHEASHFSLFDDPRMNDIWCDIFFAGPIGISVSAYRGRHASHHAQLGTSNDLDGYPYQLNVRGTRALLHVMFQSLSGVMGLWLARNKYLRVGSEPSASRISARWIGPVVTIVFNISLAYFCFLNGRWYLFFLLWVYPIVAVAIALNIVRTVAEHQPEEFPQFQDGTEVAMRPVARTTVPHWFEKWLMYQANFNFHVEHHLFPAVPRHNLPKLHRHLVEKGFYRHYPKALQRSGFKKFWRLTRNRTHDDFTDAVQDAIRL